MTAEFDREIVEKFIVPHKKGRVSLVLNNPKKRKDLIGYFHTSQILDPNVIREIKPSEQYAESIYKQMVGLGAKDECYALSAMKNIDGKILNLKEALEQVVGNTIETVLFCIKSKISYFEGGHMKDRYILVPIKNAV